jgi:hypothetical protein
MISATNTFSLNVIALVMWSQRRKQVERRVNRSLALYLGERQRPSLAVQRMRPFYRHIGLAQEAAQG